MIYSACCVQPPSKINLTKGKLVGGKVIYRAERDFPTGMIKIDELFENNSTEVKEFIESPSIAVLYDFDENKPLNLLHQVWFEIEEFYGVQKAVNIRDSLTKRDSSNLLNPREKFALFNRIYLNLHNGDKHREGPKHIRIHIKKKVRDITSLSITEIEVENYETDEISKRFIRTSDLPDEEDWGNVFYIQYDLLIDTYHVYSLDLNHIH